MFPEGRICIWIWLLCDWLAVDPGVKSVSLQSLVLLQVAKCHVLPKVCWSFEQNEIDALRSKMTPQLFCTRIEMPLEPSESCDFRDNFLFRLGEGFSFLAGPDFLTSKHVL